MPCLNNQSDVGNNSQQQSPDERVWNIYSKLLGGTVIRKSAQRQIPPLWYFSVCAGLIVLLVFFAVIFPMCTKIACTIGLALLTVFNAFVEWRGDVIKEAIDRVDCYQKSTNNEGSIAHQRELALLAKAIKFVAAFATVMIGVLIKLSV